MEIIYSKKFVSEYKKLPKPVKLLAEKREQIFKKDPFAQTLKTHKLSGKLKDFWSFSIDPKHRIIFYFKSKNEAWFMAIGTHNIYRN